MPIKRAGDVQFRLWIDALGEESGPTRIYPTGRDHGAFPADVSKLLADANSVKKHPRFYAVGIRSTIEAAARLHGVTTGDLEMRIEKLVENETLPAVFGDMAHQLRFRWELARPLDAGQGGPRRPLRGREEPGQGLNRNATLLLPVRAPRDGEHLLLPTDL